MVDLEITHLKPCRRFEFLQRRLLAQPRQLVVHEQQMPSMQKPQTTNSSPPIVAVAFASLDHPSGQAVEVQ